MVILWGRKTQTLAQHLNPSVNRLNLMHLLEGSHAILLILQDLLIFFSPFPLFSGSLFCDLSYFSCHVGSKVSLSLSQGIQLLGVDLRILWMPYLMILPRMMVAANQPMDQKQFQDQRVPLPDCSARNLLVLQTKQAIMGMIQSHKQS